MKESITLHTIGIFRDKEYEMQDLLNGLLEENNRLDNIINKAIEYINERTELGEEEYTNYCDNLSRETLINILQGSEEK